MMISLRTEKLKGTNQVGDEQEDVLISSIVLCGWADCSLVALCWHGLKDVKGRVSADGWRWRRIETQWKSNSCEGVS